MTKSISRSQVRLIASTNAIFGADEACAMLRISRDAMYRLAPLHLPSEHAIRLLVAHLATSKCRGSPPAIFYPFH